MVTEPNFTKIDCNLFSADVQYCVLGEHGVKRYIQLNLHARTRYGTTTAGHKSYIREARNISPRRLYAIDDQLENMGYISRETLSEKLTAYIVRNVPIYDNEARRIVGSHTYIWNDYSIEYFKAHYILIPNCAVRAALRMPLPKLMVFLKLYRYNSLEAFGGVDINAVRIDDSGMIIDRRISHDLQMPESNVRGLVMELVNDGLIELEVRSNTIERNGIFERLRISNNNTGIHTCSQLVPCYQWQQGGAQDA
jgi:hypothetical protein